MIAILDALGPIVWTALLLTGGLAAWNLLLFRRAPRPLADTESVSILIPARNEEANIEGAVRAACAQTASRVEVVVLDDGSTDATPRLLASLAAECPRLRVVGGKPLPPGWAGKAWACWQLGSEHARHDWLLFVDADVRLFPEAAARALAAARAQRIDLLSAFPRQLVPTPGEALLVPLMYLLLVAYLPMAFIRSNRRPSLSAACGQFMLVRREAYLAADGHRAVAGTLHDGIKLARRMKAAGFSVGILDGQDLASCRMYAGFRASWRGFARNAYEALGSPMALAVMTALNAGLFVLPFLAFPVSMIFGGASRSSVAWGLAVFLVLALRVVLAWRFSYPWWTALATPVAVLALTGIQLESYLRHLTGKPVLWRSRAYPGAAPVGRE
jgi:glycosyltransferase involved in cell wall biosynthesis